jgi:hypothetical protein
LTNFPGEETGETEVEPGSSLPRDPDRGARETAETGPIATGEDWPRPLPEEDAAGGASNSSSSILFLDDNPERASAFLTRHPEAVWVETAVDCIARLGETWHQVHLDHDLGGEVFVDSSRPDCGMEVVRWLCAEAREEHEKTLFIIHTHNAEAAETMVRSLRENHYLAVYRPFGIDLFEWLPDEETGQGEEKSPESSPRSPWMEWLGRLSRRWRPAVARGDGKAAGDPTRPEGPSTGSQRGDEQAPDTAQGP